MTQEIIVYRNPGEKAIWDAIMSPGAFPIMVAVVVFFVVLLATSNLADRYIIGGWWRNKLRTYISFGVAIAAAAATIYFM